MFKEMYPHDDLENLAEELVFEEIHRLIETREPDFPADEISILDIAAIALNHMPPKYVSSLIEKNNPHDGLVAEVKDLKRYARRQVFRALDKVRKHPHT